MIVRIASLIKATNRQRDEHKTEGRSQVMKATVPLRGTLRSAPWLCSVPGYRHHPGALCCSSSRHLLPKPAARQGLVCLGTSPLRPSVPRLGKPTLPCSLQPAPFTCLQNNRVSLWWQIQPEVCGHCSGACRVWWLSGVTGIGARVGAKVGGRC